MASGSHIAAPPPPLVFIHVPKTGGIFLDNILVRNFRRRIDSYDGNFFCHLFPDRFYYFLQAPSRDDTDRPVFFTGHIAIDNEIFARMRGRYICTTLLRDPVDRFISHYFFHKGLPDSDPYGIRRDKLTVVDYLNRYPEFARQSEIFLSPAEKTSVKAGELALRNIEAKLSFFGLQESMDEYLILLSYLLGLPNLHYRKRLNTSDYGEGIDPGQRRQIAEMMPKEIEFYRAAKALYERRLTRIPAGIRTLADEAGDLKGRGIDLGAQVQRLRDLPHPWTDAYA